MNEIAGGNFMQALTELWSLLSRTFFQELLTAFDMAGKTTKMSMRLSFYRNQNQFNCNSYFDPMPLKITVFLLKKGDCSFAEWLSILDHLIVSRLDIIPESYPKAISSKIYATVVAER